jgi:predicted PolB exonuclease-like 3'-5' exonuclease
MNKLLSDISVDDLLFFDIETARCKKDITEDDELVPMLAWKFRDKETSKKADFETCRTRFLREGGLHPSLCKIVCITVGYIHEGKLRLKSLVGDEDSIITNFYRIANGRILAGHNVKQFDMPVVRIRAFANKIKTPYNLSDSGLKPWDIGLEPRAKVKVVDSMDIIKGSYYYGISLEECCYIAGVPTPKTDLVGSKVSEAYWEEKDGLDRIARYCEKDVLSSANLILSLMGRPQVELDSSYSEEEIEELSIVDRIYSSKEISEEDKEQIRGLVGKTKLTAKDKTRLSSMLVSLVDQSDYFNTDESLSSKIEDINSFIKTL